MHIPSFLPFVVLLFFSLDTMAQQPLPAPKVTVMARGLEHPWAIDFLRDGRLIVTERKGTMRILGRDGTLSKPLSGVPAVATGGQNGLLDVGVWPGDKQGDTLFFTYAEPVGGDSNTSRLALARARLEGNALQGMKVIYRQKQASGKNHFGSRVAFHPDGSILLGTGERWDYKEEAQKLDSNLGKVLRLTPGGKPARSNPFSRRKGALPEIWSYGHRNIQALTLEPETSRVLVIEHGARGGDELNIAQAGKNYGWPVITYSRDYVTRLPIGEGTERADVVAPVKQWTPCIAPSGLLYYTGTLFPQWKDNLFVGALAGKALKRITLRNDRVLEEEDLLQDRGKRIRDVIQDKQGAIWVATDEDDGEIWKLTPASVKQ